MLIAFLIFGSITFPIREDQLKGGNSNPTEPCKYRYNRRTKGGAMNLLQRLNKKLLTTGGLN